MGHCPMTDCYSAVFQYEQLKGTLNLQSFAKRFFEQWSRIFAFVVFC